MVIFFEFSGGGEIPHLNILKKGANPRVKPLQQRGRDREEKEEKRKN
jgi:hypothetical protein